MTHKLMKTFFVLFIVGLLALFMVTKLELTSIANADKVTLPQANILGPVE